MHAKTFKVQSNLHQWPPYHKVPFFSDSVDVFALVPIGSFSNGNGDDNEKGKKQYVLLANRQLWIRITLFCTFLCRHSITTT